VLCASIFWVGGSVLSLTGETPELWFVPVFVVSFASIAWFYWTLFSIAGRETGRSPWAYFGFRIPRLHGPDNVFAFGREGWSVLLKLLSPGWWAQVIRATGWPFALTAACLVGSLALVVVAALTGGFGVN